MSRRSVSLRFPTALTHEAVTEALTILAAEGRPPLLSPLRPVVLELVLDPRSVSWCLSAEEQVMRRVSAGIRFAVPGVSLSDAESGDRLGAPGAACELKLVSPLRPLTTEVAETLAHRLLATAGHLGTGEKLVVQWVVGPWLPRLPLPPATSSAPPRTIWNLPDWGRPNLDSEQIQQARKKQAEHLFGCVGRVAVWGATGSRARQLVGEIVGAYQLLRAPGAGFSRRWLPSSCVAARLGAQRVSRRNPPCRLMTSELAAVIGWPIGNPDVLGAEYVRARTIRADERTLVPLGATGHRALGESTASGRPGTLVLPAKDGLRHLHVIGPTGSGKSWLLANLILSDIEAGRGVVVIDAKGDLVNDVLARLPAERRDAVVLLDATDRAPVGVNPLVGGDLAVDGLLHVMKSVWASSWGPRLGDVLHAGALTLARSPGHTLVELPTLLTDEHFRRSLVRSATANDPLGVGSFWSWYEAISQDARLQVLAPVMNKLRSFLLRPDLRAVLGQPTPRFDLRDVFTKRLVLLVRLSRGALGPEGAQLLGSLLMTSLWQTALARSAVPAERRTPVFVYLDEFQEFLRLNIDLGDALAQARGLGVGLVLAHQHLGQLDQGLRGAVMANVGNRVVFGLDHEDANVMAKRTGGYLSSDDFTNLPAFHAYASVLVDGASGPYASIRTRPIPQVTTELAVLEAKNRERWGIDRAQTEARLREVVAGNADERPPPGSLGGRRRLGEAP